MPLDVAQLFHSILHIDQLIAGASSGQGAAIYLALFAIIFCEMAFVPLFFLPGDPLLFVCGAFCAAGVLNIWWLLPLLLVATILGSSINYAIGRAVGERLAERTHRWLNPTALARTRQFYHARGRQTFLVSPYIAVVRTFAPFVAGVSGMVFREFIVAVFGGAFLWVVGLLMAGYYFGNVPWVRAHVGAITVVGLALALCVLAVGHLVKLLRAKV